MLKAVGDQPHKDIRETTPQDVVDVLQDAIKTYPDANVLVLLERQKEGDTLWRSTDMSTGDVIRILEMAKINYFHTQQHPYNDQEDLGG